MFGVEINTICEYVLISIKLSAAVSLSERMRQDVISTHLEL